MKKKIVFVIPSLAAGGGEKSLVNLLNTINYSDFDVDLMLFSQTGLFLNTIPKEVNILSSSKNHVIFSQNIIKSAIQFCLSFQFSLAFHRIVFTLKNAFYKNKAKAEQQSWSNKKHSFSTLSQSYDVAIAFLEKSSIYFVIDKINADKKIAWIHTNYSNSGMSASFDANYFSKLNNIITVSKECEDDLKFNFPNLKNKFSVIYNIVSPKLIHSLSNEKIDDTIFENSIPIILTVARLSHEKGIDIAIETCAILISKKIKIKWLVIGDGNEKASLQQKINQHNLQNHFILIGLKQNPYPYIKNAAIYVQPSRYEGKSIAIDEAKILQKPIVVTNFDTAKDQIKHQYNGIISSMNPIDLATDIELLITNKTLSNKLSLHLGEENFGTEQEIEKLYLLMN